MAAAGDKTLHPTDFARRSSADPTLDARNVFRFPAVKVVSPMNRLTLTLLLFVGSLGCARAQDADYVELSAFAVTSRDDRSYASPQPHRPNVAITLTKPADAVVMDVTLVNSSDKGEDKNRDVLATIRALERTVATVPGLRFERREIQLRGEARRKSLFSRGNVTSYANVALVAPLGADADLFALVDKMRAAIAQSTPSGNTRILDGAVYLLLERPEQYRAELLAAIFKDLELLKEKLGERFEVLPAGLDKAIQVRAASEKTVELWLDYTMSIRSVLELSNPKPGKN